MNDVANYFLIFLNLCYICVYRELGKNTRPYDSLTRGSRWKIEAKYQSHAKKGNHSIASSQHQGPFFERPNLFQEPCGMLLKMRDAHQALNAGIVQSIIQGFFKACALKVLAKYPISLQWTWTFMKFHLKWSYQCATTTCGKLLPD